MDEITPFPFIGIVLLPISKPLSFPPVWTGKKNASLQLQYACKTGAPSKLTCFQDRIQGPPSSSCLYQGAITRVKPIRSNKKHLPGGCLMAALSHHPRPSFPVKKAWGLTVLAVQGPSPFSSSASERSNGTHPASSTIKVLK